MPSNPQRDAELFRLQEKQTKFETERTALFHRIMKLNHQIGQVQAEYGAVYNEPAPLLTLSTEVTCLIFDFTVAAGFTTARQALADQEDKRKFFPEVVVSQVCHQWRSISLAYPALWARFCYDSPHASRVPLYRLDAYLERSASQPLELWFNFRGSEDREWTVDGHLALLRRSIPAITRWKCFTVLSDPTTPVDALLSEIASLSAQNLEHFVFCPGVEADTDDSSASSVEDVVIEKDFETTIFKNGTPKLKSLTLDCSYKCLPPLSNITTLRLEAPNSGLGMVLSWGAFRNVLSISSLENLSLVGPVLENHYHRMKLITMNSLKNLRFGNLKLLWLPFLRAPLLATLIIRKCWIDSLFGYDQVLKSEPYAFPTLRSLCLIRTTAQSFQIAHHLAQMTELATDIVFSQENGTNRFSSLVLNHEDSRSETYWTQAVQITFNSYVLDFRQIIHFVKARRMNNMTLRINQLSEYQWRGPPSLEFEECKELSKICTLEILDDKTIDKALWKMHWQFGGNQLGCPMDDDSEGLFAVRE
ncbi:hypothetical protein GALMADRAFT_264302 [Galerina marginata CBS 339.88]|uniref:F-box domain-containing protein n=1 Tax=Galerina marginata (strain CBS 339.88) TaxID=685588 RepID=A0A067TFP7_GALM3|nr:hypothetical protein GALMADRAFT_264302 [Galerina marginata CBS 339.88]